MDYNYIYIIYNGETVKDYKNGYCVRFADDLYVMARTEKDALIFRDKIKEFVAKRGLKLSEKKTKIVNIKNGFDFLSRFYYKTDGIVHCVPSEKAIINFENEVEELIFSNKENWSQRKIIQSLNAKISGFTAYHKCEESTDTFKYLDVMINALLLKLLKGIYSKMTNEQLIKKYWIKDGQNRDTFAFTSNRNIKLHSMADTLLVKEEKIDTKKNIFIDKEYFEEIDKKQDIQNIVGKYRKVWDRQDGKCHICSKPITREQNKSIIYKKSNKDKSIKNIAYIHTECKNSIVEYIKVENSNVKSINIRELLNEIDTKSKRKRKKNSKFVKLSEYFHNVHKNKVSLTFKTIEKILGFKLCDSAYKYKTYFTNNKNGLISESWRKQGFKITKVDLDNQILEFIRVEFKRTKVQIPKFLYRTDLSTELVEEVKQFFIYIQEKYRIS